MATLRKRIALVAHDNCKAGLVEWVRWNWNILHGHRLICTGTTGQLIQDALQEEIERNRTSEKVKITPPRIIKLKSGPLGGDQQLGALIAEGRIDILIFFWDPMQPHPHDVDVKALLRISVVYNIPVACNRSTADFLISSTLMNEPYEPILRDYSDYLNRIY
ncbi:MAG TPA: methylglyoxal synthase [Bacteroidales bacterium]|nr:methylglyoxal synthase [Bacteroidales bacterium]